MLVALAKTSEQHLASVGHAVAVGIFEKQNVGSGGDQQSAAHRQHTGRKGDAGRENGGGFVAAVVIAIFEKTDAPLAGPDRIVLHFGDVHFFTRVPSQGHGADDRRLGRDQLDHQVFVGQAERGCLGLGREGGNSGCWRIG